jgi:hypothetical protein
MYFAKNHVGSLLFPAARLMHARMKTHMFVRRWFGIWGMARSFIIGMTMGLVTDPVANCSVILSIIVLDFLLNAVGHPHVDNITYVKQFIMIGSRLCTVTVTFLFFQGIISDVQMEALFTFFTLVGFFPSLIETIYTTVRNVMSLFSAATAAVVNPEELKEQKESFVGALCLSVVTIFKDTLPAKLQELLPKKVLPAWCCQCLKEASRGRAAGEAEVTSASKEILLKDEQHALKSAAAIPAQKKIPRGSDDNTQPRNFPTVSSSLVLLCSGNLPASSSRDSSQTHEPLSLPKPSSPAHDAGTLPTKSPPRMPSPPKMKPPGSNLPNLYPMQLSTTPLQIQPIQHKLPTFLLSPSTTWQSGSPPPSKNWQSGSPLPSTTWQSGSPPPVPPHALPLPEPQALMASSPVRVASPGSPIMLTTGSPPQ